MSRLALVAPFLVTGLLVGLAACPHDSTNLPPADAWIALDAPDHAGAGNGGGKLAELRFAVVGDTRPANLDDTAHYPTDIITAIWQDVEAEVPHPQFAVTTGDYMFASTTGSEQAPQLDAYLGARGGFHGVVYPALGNHECTGYTASNCGDGAADGVTVNYTQFLTRLLAPIGEARPYFAERFAAADGSWTAKLVFVAPNAWDNVQAYWLDAILGEPTTYTFVIRHEDHGAKAPGVVPSGNIIANHPLTLLIVGHSHTYEHDALNHELIVGNGGAPLTTGTNYGYVIVARRADGAIAITASDYLSHAVLDTFALSPDGAPLPP
jgi:hypothetical protein